MRVRVVGHVSGAPPRGSRSRLGADTQSLLAGCLPHPPLACRRHRIQETLRLEQADNGRITVDIEWKTYF